MLAMRPRTSPHSRLIRSHSAARLAAIFTAIAGAATAGACGGEVDRRIDTTDFAGDVCQGGQFPGAILDLRPATPVDGSELRADHDRFGAKGGTVAKAG